MDYTREQLILLSRIWETNSKNRLTRAELVDMFGSDRRGREVIEELQRSGWRIISGYGQGYWLAEDHLQYESWKRREMTRATSIMSKLRVMDKGIVDDDPQVVIADYVELLKEAEGVADV